MVVLKLEAGGGGAGDDLGEGVDDDGIFLLLRDAGERGGGRAVGSHMHDGGG